ncbi:MAG TPA: sensor histidine kinase [Actinophytocola sp.]|uniref:sensor histidine kinase n=1 Tax=Actinophytocola sp. TaxID=1872138 RepID=UPI002DBF54AB|nr:sensor histidine kinase [Actinophytocola sp.]HEU5469429.1 sensor histidine kinase [Actinophytocola sp.]
MSGQAGARRLPVSLLLLTLTLLGVAAWCLASRAAAPSDGTTISSGDAPISSDGVIVTAVLDPAGPVRPGDRVVAINGISLTDRIGGRPGGPPAGDPVRYELLRGDQRVVVDVALRPYPVWSALAAGWPTLLVTGLLLITAVAVFLVRPLDPAAQAALSAAALTVVTTSGSAYFGLEAIDLVAGDQFWRWYTGEFAYALVWGAMLHFALAFPAITHRARYRWLVTLGYLGPVVLYGVTAGVAVLLPDPVQRLYVLGAPALPTLFVYPLCVLGVLVHKYLRCTEDQIRRPLRWLATTLGGGVAVYLAVWVLPSFIGGQPLLPDRFHALAFVAVPVAVVAAILRHQALDIEVVVSRSLVYGALSAGVIGLYIGLVGALSLVFPPIQSLWVQAAVAATIAVAVQPLRARLQAVINKRLFGDADDPYRVVSTLASRLENTHTPGAMLPAMVETVSTALRLPYVAIEITARGRTETAASVGAPTGELHRMPLTFQGERVGYLVIAPRGPREGLRRRDRVALAEVTRHAGAAVYTARLTRDLRRSRDRLVRAREKERRRILHELHDGVGPTLAAVALGIDASQRSIGNDTATGVLLGRLRDELQAAIVEIRRLAHGLRPPVLDRIGLIPAIREYAAALASRTARGEDSDEGVNIVLEVPSVLPKLPASVDVAAYRIICEALTNVTRHAAARSCAVRLWVDDDLHIEVVDDGIGIGQTALTDGGVGLTSMRERAAELGGDCLVEADREGGTRVFATLPLPKEAP